MIYWLDNIKPLTISIENVKPNTPKSFDHAIISYSVTVNHYFT